MKRREFITLLGGAAALAAAARAQQAERMRRIGVLMPSRRTTRKRRLASRPSSRGCSELGWIDGRNVRIEYRWATGDADQHSRTRCGIGRACAGRHPCCRHRVDAAAAAGDPHRADRVRQRRRSGRRRFRREPGATGRKHHRVSRVNTALSGKWLELLRRSCPASCESAVIRDPATAAGFGTVRRDPIRGAVARR